jgi:hypothetical protein
MATLKPSPLGEMQTALLASDPRFPPRVPVAPFRAELNRSGSGKNYRFFTCSRIHG